MANGDVALESITFTYRRGDTQEVIRVAPREGPGECLTARGVGSVFFRRRDMDRALGFHRPRDMNRFRIDESGSPVPVPSDSPPPFPLDPDEAVDFEHEVIGRAEELPAWRIDSFCFHCDGCGWICYSF